MKKFLLLYTFAVVWLVPVGAYAAETPVVDDAGRELGENVSTRPTWISILAFISWVLVRVLKDPSVKIDVPVRWRPAVAFLIALTLGALEGLILHGFTWTSFLEGLQNGFAAGGGAIIFQELIVRFLLGGKTEPPPGPAPSAKTGVTTTIFMGALYILLVGCASPLKGLIITADTAAATAEAARPVLKGACTDPMLSLLAQAREAKTAADEAELRKIRDQFAKLAPPCDVAMDAQDTLLKAHTVARAAIVASAAGGSLATTIAVATKLVEAATKLGAAIEALPKGASK